MDPEDLEDESAASEEEEAGDEGSISSDEFEVDGKTDMLNLPELRDPDEDNPSSFFYVNRFLPPVERDSVDEEGRRAVENIRSVLDDVEREFHDDDLLKENTLLSFTHKLNAHMDLKYPLSVRAAVACTRRRLVVHRRLFFRRSCAGESFCWLRTFTLRGRRRPP